MPPNISVFCQGVNAASWTDSVINQVISYIWGGREQDFDEYYLYPGYTVKEIKECLKEIKQLAEQTKWFPYQYKDHVGFTPLKDALDLYKKQKHLYQ